MTMRMRRLAGIVFIVVTITLQNIRDSHSGLLTQDGTQVTGSIPPFPDSRCLVSGGRCALQFNLPVEYGPVGSMTIRVGTDQPQWFGWQTVQVGPVKPAAKPTKRRSVRGH